LDFLVLAFKQRVHRIDDAFDHRVRIEIQLGRNIVRR
jgi:hypothetical protein